MVSSQPTRRDFLGATTVVATAGALAVDRVKAAPLRLPLSLPTSMLKSSYDVVVIGSGYGGAIMAARLASRHKVCVLERGREWMPNEFPADLPGLIGQFRNETKPLGLFDYRVGLTMDTLTGNGLGGTSLINANVVISPDREIFSRWPAVIQQDDLQGRMDGWEARVRQTLSLDAIVEADALRKHAFHRTTTLEASRQGVPTSFQPLHIAVNLRRYNQQANEQGVQQALCTHCGDCVTGCRVGAKNTLDVNYLPLARATGAEIFSRIEVDWLERLPDGRWLVHALLRQGAQSVQHVQILAASVVLSAGTLGSTEILLRSRSRGLSLSDALGTRFSANGDLLGFGYNTDVQTNVMGYGVGAPPPGEQRVGPTITGAASYRTHPLLSERYLIEDAAIPKALFDAVRLAMPAAAGLFADVPAAQRVARDLVSLRSDGALNHSMVYLGIGHDSATGRLVLDSKGSARVHWPGVTSEPFVARIRDEMERHAQVFAGRHVDSPRSSPIFGGAMTTVHPLGGCPMAERSSDGVVNADGQVFHPRLGATAVYANLRVVDGSIAPASIGVNPLLCIAALAERSAERFTL
jgi:cholesterol oxidase